MRPTVVLPLVLVAVAALVAAFFFNSRNGTTGVDPVAIKPVPTQTNQTPRVVEPDKLVEDTTPNGGRKVDEDGSSSRQAIDGVTLSAAVDSADQTSSIEVTVRDGAGTAIESAIVTLMIKRPGAELAPFLQAAGGADQGLDLAQSKISEGRTKKDGVFTFERLESSPFFAIEVGHPDFAPKELRGIAVASGKRVPISIVLDQGSMVHGYVRDEGGNLVEGAQMLLMPLGALNLDQRIQMENGRTTKTNSDGYYAFRNVDLGKMNTISAHKSGFGRAAQTDLRQEGADPTVEVDFRLAPGLSIRGRVVGANGQAVEGATIDAYGFVAIQNARGTTTTKADGTFELVDLLDGPYQIRASAKGWAMAREPRVDAGEQNLLLELQPLGEVSGRVVQTANNQPLRSFRISVRRVTPGSDMKGPPTLPHDFANAEDGAFVMTGVPEGAYVLQAEAEGFAPALSTSFEVRLGQVVSGMEIRISTGGAIRGRVVDAATGDPIAGAKLTTQDNGFIDNPLAQMFGAMLARSTTSRTAVTDAEGRFTLSQLMAGDYQIRIEHPSFTLSIVKDLRVDDTPEPLDYGDFPLREGGSIEGMVYDENGAPMKGATVSMSHAEVAGMNYQARTDEEGRYSIDHLQPGRYQIHAMRVADSGGNPFEGLLDVQRSQREVFVAEGARQAFDLSMAQ